MSYQTKTQSRSSGYANNALTAIPQRRTAPRQSSSENFGSFLSAAMRNLGNSALLLSSKTFRFKLGRRAHRYSLPRLLSIIIGGFILVLCMQHSASAQMLQGAEDAVQTLFSGFLPDGADNIIQVMFGVARVIFFGLLFVVIAFAANESRRGGSMDVWFAAGSVLVIGLVLMQAASQIVFGGG